MHDPFVEARIVARRILWARQYALLQFAASNSEFVAEGVKEGLKYIIKAG